VSLPALLRRFWIVRAPRLFVRVADPSDPELGLLGEEIAARHLASRGFTIESRRCRNAEAEVDIVARDGACLVCIEVKTGRVAPCPRPRGMDRETARELARRRWRSGARLGPVQIERLRSAARALARGRANACRVDLVEVSFDLASRRFHVEHHVDVRRPILERPSERRGEER
jgi:Holliday junction resolvase-like predicted endonuclease